MSTDTLLRQLERISERLGVTDPPPIQLDRPRDPAHGDLATNLALTLAKRVKRPPRDVAQLIIEQLELASAGIATAEIAGPGFINFRFSPASLHARLTGILAADAAWGRVHKAKPRRVMVEFVSANPTGPLHVAHGRGAALGDGIAALLEHTGDDVTREFYVNDAGVQIDKLAESLDVRLRQLAGEDATIPEGGYHGEYLTELARSVAAQFADRLQTLSGDQRLRFLRDHAVQVLREQQDGVLRTFGVHFDEYSLETRLYQEGKLEETLAELRERELVYDKEGAVWLRTSDFGDDKDRVLVKSDGSFTYFLPDLAYHREKARRGFEYVINVWGADHHGYVPRMKAALAALGLPDLLDVEIVQMVRLMRGAEEVKLSKRAGQIVTLEELVDEIGVDVARYFFLMRRGDAQMLFDLDLALDHSDKNPVYKVQYAHARMMSVFRKADVVVDEVAADDADLSRLTHPLELELIKQLSEFPEVIRRAADTMSPHLVCEYLETTAAQVNSWYHAGNPNRNPELAVLTADDGLRRARLVLARAIRIVLRNGVAVLGLSAPERMDREEVE
jgi:arginyl-tRNA synthetase